MEPARLNRGTARRLGFTRGVGALTAQSLVWASIIRPLENRLLPVPTTVLHRDSSRFGGDHPRSSSLAPADSRGGAKGSNALSWTLSPKVPDRDPVGLPMSESIFDPDLIAQCHVNDTGSVVAVTDVQTATFMLVI